MEMANANMSTTNLIAGPEIEDHGDAYEYTALVARTMVHAYLRLFPHLAAMAPPGRIDSDDWIAAKAVECMAEGNEFYDLYDSADEWEKESLTAVVRRTVLEELAKIRAGKAIQRVPSIDGRKIS